MNRLSETMIPPRLLLDERSGRLYGWFVSCHLLIGLLALALSGWV